MKPRKKEIAIPSHSKHQIESILKNTLIDTAGENPEVVADENEFRVKTINADIIHDDKTGNVTILFRNSITFAKNALALLQRLLKESNKTSLTVLDDKVIISQEIVVHFLLLSEKKSSKPSSTNLALSKFNSPPSYSSKETKLNPTETDEKFSRELQNKYPRGSMKRVEIEYKYHCLGLLKNELKTVQHVGKFSALQRILDASGFKFKSKYQRLFETEELYLKVKNKIIEAFATSKNKEGFLKFGEILNIEPQEISPIKSQLGVKHC